MLGPLRTLIAFAGSGVVLAGLVACTSGSPGPTETSTVVLTQTRTLAPPTTTPIPVPVDVGPTTAAAGDCPYIVLADAQDDLGVRLGRQVVLRAGGRQVGCRFYADQDPSYVASEHLPGPNQPVLEIDASQYASAAAAKDAASQIGAAGGNAHAVAVSPTLSGVAYQTTFDPADGVNDWAFVFSSGTAVVIVKTAQSDVELNAQTVAAVVAPKV